MIEISTSIKIYSKIRHLHHTVLTEDEEYLSSPPSAIKVKSKFCVGISIDPNLTGLSREMWPGDIFDPTRLEMS